MDITGLPLGGGPFSGDRAGVRWPLRTISTSRGLSASGFPVARGGPISATMRSRLVTNTVSPEAARRTYSLKRLFSSLIPTALMESW